MSENGGFDMVEKINLKTEEEGEMAEEDGEGGEEVASNLITQINVAWREQLPEQTKERGRGDASMLIYDSSTLSVFLLSHSFSLNRMCQHTTLSPPSLRSAQFNKFYWASPDSLAYKVTRQNNAS